MFVGGLAVRCDDEALEAFFAPYHALPLTAHVVLDTLTRLARGFGARADPSSHAASPSVALSLPLSSSHPLELSPTASLSLPLPPSLSHTVSPSVSLSHSLSPSHPLLRRIPRAARDTWGGTAPQSCPPCAAPAWRQTRPLVRTGHAIPHLLAPNVLLHTACTTTQTSPRGSATLHLTAHVQLRTA